MDFINTLNQEQIRKDIPAFHSGDTLDVHLKIVEGTKERIQLFTGTVIQVRGTGVGKTFTIRKISNGIGVERIIPLNSPQIDKIVRVKEGKVRRSRIFYFRQRRGKSARIKEARTGRS
ncbi:MAG: 50S ribosomal protein L19 [Candidatus Delongbacteria bacterium]|jgi:large subunit ribosomal protein L19|nr:50S ribosomal protein L19 [Candidatus Delongbacteria bacterium]